MNPKNNITPFDFEENLVRTVVIDSEVCWITADLAKALGFKNIRETIRHFPENEKGVINSDTLGGPGVRNSDTRSETSAEQRRELGYVTEAGLYRLIFRSNLPAAERFQNFVFQTVLPSLRKHGFYSHRTDQLLSLSRELLELGFSAKDAAILVRGEFPPITRHEQRMQELREANELALSQDVKLAAQNELFLLEMRPGVTYSIKDFHAMLPDKHPFRKLSAPAWNSSIGKLIQQLVGSGRIVKLTGKRLATYALAESREKIVPMER